MADPYVNQLPNLIAKGVEKNHRFLRSLWTESAFDRAIRAFDQLVTVRREPDPEMTLSRFLKGMRKNTHIVLQIGSPNAHELRYGAGYHVADARKHVFIDLPYTPQNFDLIARHYETAFGTRLIDEPAEPWMLAYYHEFRRNYPGLTRFA